MLGPSDNVGMRSVLLVSLVLISLATWSEALFLPPTDKDFITDISNRDENKFGKEAEKEVEEEEAIMENIGKEINDLDNFLSLLVEQATELNEEFEALKERKELEFDDLQVKRARMKNPTKKMQMSEQRPNNRWHSWFYAI